MLARDPGGPGTLARAVFVCEGNTCRSPLAEAIAVQLFGGPASRFTSAGLAARDGQPASEGALAVARELGLDLGAHRSRSLRAVAWRGVGWCVAMTRGQAARLRAAGLPEPGLRLGVLGAPGTDLAAGGASPACEEVADPWGGDPETYRETAAQLRRLLAAWAPHLGAAGHDEGTRP